jgi:short-subunit dehydrogenase
LGEAIAMHLVKAGAKVIVTGRRADALKAIAEKAGAKTIVADLALRDDVKRIEQEAGPIDILIANAAIPATGHFAQLDEAFIDRTLEVNLKAPLLLAKSFLAPMLAKRDGHMVFISSLAGRMPAPESTMYCASKYGMRGFALALREDLHGTGVGVSTIFPGFIRDAGMFAKTGVKLPAVMGTKTPDQVAEAVTRAIRKNVAELVVASADQRFGAFMATLTPGLISTIQRTFGGGAVAKAIVSTQRHIR